MIHSEYEDEKIDKDLVIEFANKLIEEHKSFNKVDLGSVMNRQQAIHAAQVTCRMLAQATAKKFYYEAITYLMELPNE